MWKTSYRVSDSEASPTFNLFQIHSITENYHNFSLDLIMEKLNREDISIASKHSNLSREQIENLLEENVYVNTKDWKRFLDVFLLVLGIGFVVSGIIFFFAFNWADLNKFIKIGIILLLLVATVLCALILKINEVYRNTLLTAASMLVGVLFAVFGQIYQTGANAYDFFLAWTIFITIWVIATRFYPLFLLHIILINTTIFLFNDQVLNSFDPVSMSTLLFFINGSALTALLSLNHYRKIQIPLWFRNTFTLIVTSIATIGLCYLIFDSRLLNGLLLIFGTLACYSYYIYYALQTKSTFFIGTIAFSILIITNCLLIRIFEDEFVLIIISLFVIIMVTAIIKLLLNLQRKWTNEK